MDYFSADYLTARSRFRDAVLKTGGRLDSLALRARGPAGDPLTIDAGWFGTDHPRRVLLHSSGIHGVEGFAGSAIQLQFLSRPPVVARNAALVMVPVESITLRNADSRMRSPSFTILAGIRTPTGSRSARARAAVAGR